MEITANGTAVDLNQGIYEPFSLHFDLAGGKLVTAGCDSQYQNAHVSDFAAVINGQHFNAPSNFVAAFIDNPYPTCSSPHIIEIESVPSGNAYPWLTLEYWTYPGDPGRHSMFAGNVGNYYLANANYVLSSVPEPGTLSLVAIGLLAAVLLAKRSRSSLTRAITPSQSPRVA